MTSGRGADAPHTLTISLACLTVCRAPQSERVQSKSADNVDQVAKAPGYHLSVDDINAWEQEHGRIPEGSVVRWDAKLGMRVR